MTIREDQDHDIVKNSIGMRPMVIKPKKLVFYAIFVFVFLLSGVITMLDVIPFRMNLISLLVIPLFILFGVRVDHTVFAFGLLTAAIFFSAGVNQVSITQLALFMRGVLYSFLIYSLVKLVVTRDNIRTIIRLCVIVGMVQLPIMLVQIMTYDYLPNRIISGLGVSRIDYDFGTFHFKGDAAMTFFVTLLVIFLLFDNTRNYVVRHRRFVAIWLTLTVLVSNAELMKLAIAIVWFVYAIRYFNIRTLLFGIIALFLLAGILILSGVLDEIIADFNQTLASNLSTSPEKTESFLSGGYGRGAAFAYYLNDDFKWIGDGPSRYYDVITKTRTRGNTGHIFTYYAEVGMIGLLLSYLIFFLIAFPIRDKHLRVRWVGILMFVILVLLSVTTEVFSNVSIVLIYSIVAMTYLIPEELPSPLQLAD